MLFGAFLFVKIFLHHDLLSSLSEPSLPSHSQRLKKCAGGKRFSKLCGRRRTQLQALSVYIKLRRQLRVWQAVGYGQCHMPHGAT